MYAWLIPLFPLLGFLINGLIGARLPKVVSGTIATVAVFASFAVAVVVFLTVQGSPAVHHAVYLAPWMSVPTVAQVNALQVNWELLLDPLSAMMLLIITGIGGLIHLYSMGYMAADKLYSRFFTYLNLFIFFMLLLVLGNNMVMMFVGWEGVGLCSYLLIGFFFEKKSAADAAKKAMIVNRIGDVGVMIAMFMALRHFGTLDFYSGHAALDGSYKGILEQAPSLAALVVASPLAMTIITTLALMLFWGCTGKSAQLPLYTWLPDAMEGPTPVSALIHAATMVTAGVYIVSRMHTVFELSPLAMETVAIVGISTALFAATIGLVQNDIKRVLAYSTVSQLGYMFAACGVGAFSAGMFHVLTHAFFKACLFLGSGAVIHAMEHAIHHRQEHEHGHGHESETHQEHGGETAAQKSPGPDPNDPQDMRNMGGLWNKIPLTFWMMLIATAAIAGIPLTSGFFSKDEILYQLSGQSPEWAPFLLWSVGALTSALTAFYMTRLMFKTFGGTPKTEDAKNARGEMPTMSIPIGILGILALIGGYLWVPSLFGGAHPLETFLDPASGASFNHNPHPFAPAGALLGISSLIAIFFVLLAYFQYKAKDGRDLAIPATEKPRNGVYQLVLNKYYVDELYNFIFVRGGKALATFTWRILDNDLVNGLVNGIGSLARGIGSAFRATQTGYVRNYALSLFFGVLIVVIACLAEYQRLIIR